MLVMFVACNTNEQQRNDKDLEIRGMILEVHARDISEIESFKLAGEDGSEYNFSTNGFIGFTPSHLLEHQALGEPVSVKYIDHHGVLLALELAD